MTHWSALMFLAVAVSSAFAFLMRDTVKERLIFGLKMLAGFLLFTLVAGWVAFFLPFG